MLTRGIAESVTRGVAELKAAGATVVAETSSTGAGWSTPAVFLAASVDRLREGSRLLEECFGPVAVVIEYDRLDDALSRVDRLQGAMAASIMASEDDQDAPLVLAHLERGRTRHRQRLANGSGVHLGAGARRPLTRDVRSTHDVDRSGSTRPLRPSRGLSRCAALDVAGATAPQQPVAHPSTRRRSP
jgi:hypothetical protein